MGESSSNTPHEVWTRSGIASPPKPNLTLLSGGLVNNTGFSPMYRHRYIYAIAEIIPRSSRDLSRDLFEGRCTGTSTPTPSTLTRS